MAKLSRRVPLQVVWFKRDLRAHDHAALAQAARHGPVLPLYVAEPGLWAQADSSGRQWAFVAECLEELRDALAALGQPLVVRSGEICAVLDSFRQQPGIAALWSHQETGTAWTYARDRRVSAWCRAHGIPWQQPRQHGVIRGLESRGGWARRWDGFMAQDVVAPPKALPPLAGFASGQIPTARDLGLAPDPCPERQAGGRAQGLALLESFLTRRGRDYRRAMSSPVTAYDSCSRLSPHLAWGSLSMREAAQAAWNRSKRLADDPGAEARAWRASVSSFIGRLHWHCHFIQKLENEPAIEMRCLHAAYDGLRPDRGEEAFDRSAFEAWCAGETGFPFVDACLRALKASGWINFRMRAMLMSFCSYHLWLHWRAPGLELARLFTDYEPGIHWPQVQMQSGTTGINTPRIYNPVKQGLEQDPDGRFTRRWLPELAAVPDRHLQTPWTWEGAARLLGQRYPAPIVDHAAAARHARAAIWAVRKGADYRATANAIQARHGSRKSGLPPTARKRVASKASVDPRQTRLALSTED